MTCDLPVRECLWTHYAGNIVGAKIENDGRTVRADCPSCGAERGLQVSLGDRAKFTWNCHGGCDYSTVRFALARAGVPGECLPRLAGTEIAILDRIKAVIAEQDPNRAATIFWIAAIARGYTKWPEGDELEQVARDAGVSRASAFAARLRGPLLGTPPGNTSSATKKTGCQAPAGHVGVSREQKVQPTGQVQPTGLAEVQPTGQIRTSVDTSLSAAVQANNQAKVQWAGQSAEQLAERASSCPSSRRAMSSSSPRTGAGEIRSRPVHDHPAMPPAP